MSLRWWVTVIWELAWFDSYHLQVLGFPACWWEGDAIFRSPADEYRSMGVLFMETHVGRNRQSESKIAYLCSCWSGKIVMATEEASGGKSCCWDFIHSGEGFLNEISLLRDNWLFLLPPLVSWLAKDKYEHTFFVYSKSHIFHHRHCLCSLGELWFVGIVWKPDFSVAVRASDSCDIILQISLETNTSHAECGQLSI